MLGNVKSGSLESGAVAADSVDSPSVDSGFVDAVAVAVSEGESSSSSPHAPRVRARTRGRGSGRGAWVGSSDCVHARRTVFALTRSGAASIPRGTARSWRPTPSRSAAAVVHLGAGVVEERVMGARVDREGGVLAEPAQLRLQAGGEIGREEPVLAPRTGPRPWRSSADQSGCASRPRDQPVERRHRGAPHPAAGSRSRARDHRPCRTRRRRCSRVRSAHEVVDSARHVLAGLGHVQGHHQLPGTVGFAGRPTVEEVGRQRGEARVAEAVGDVGDVRRRAPTTPGSRARRARRRGRSTRRRCRRCLEMTRSGPCPAPYSGALVQACDSLF